ncbi:MAG: hypothetical protein V2A76_03060 [Planctomycetota bacterium]
MADEVVEVRHLHELLGDVDEAEFIDEEPPEQGHTQGHLYRDGQVGLIDARAAVSLHGVSDLRQSGPGILQTLDQEDRLMLVDPRVNEADDLVLAQVPCGKFERLFAQIVESSQRTFRERPLLVSTSLPQRFRQFLISRKQTLGFSDAAPAKMIDHLPGDSIEQVRVGLPQEFQQHVPRLPRATSLRSALNDVRQRRVFAAERALSQKEADVIGDGSDEAAFFLQERPFVGLRTLLGVVYAQLADLLPLGDNVRRLAPWSLDEIGG